MGTLAPLAASPAGTVTLGSGLTDIAAIADVISVWPKQAFFQMVACTSPAHITGMNSYREALFRQVPHIQLLMAAGMEENRAGRERYRTRLHAEQ